MRDNVLWRKISHIVMILAEELAIDTEKALDIFYTSKVYQQLSDERYGLYLMSDKYIVEDILNEIKSGVSEELLAYVQLSGNTVDIVTTINGRELLLFMKLRSCNRAQWEIRDFAIDMLKKLRAADSTVFNFYGPSCYVAKCPEGPLTCGKAAEVIEAIKNL